VLITKTNSQAARGHNNADATGSPNALMGRNGTAKGPRNPVKQNETPESG